jgi:PBSX family phage terminase large subunit
MEVILDIDEEDITLPVYWHLHTDEHFDIDFLYGGRDSGKSREIAQKLVLECLTLPYFKCILTRKVKDTIKESQWDLIKSVVEDWGLEQFFTFNVSPLEIKCANGNRFIARGLDEPTKLKSVNNPSHCWVEEGNQIEGDDFAIILTSLRFNDGNVKTYFSFNPECEVNYTEFWLWQDWFSHTEDLSFTYIKKIEDEGQVYEYKIRATHSTYKDNPYCKPQRKALYESYKHSKNNAYWYQTYTLGLWGYRRTGGNFWKSFDETRDIADIAFTDTPMHVVLDSNVAPYLSVSIWQLDVAEQKLNQVFEIPAKHPDNTASKAAKLVLKFLQSRHYNHKLYVYGDPSGKAKNTIDDDGKSFFDKFIGVLKPSYTIVNKVQASAPRVALSGDFINEIYESNYDGWTIRINTICRTSIEDYLMTKEAADGTILKKRITDKGTGQSYERYGHYSDCKRYFITTVLHESFKKFLARKNPMPEIGGITQVNRAGSTNITY